MLKNLSFALIILLGTAAAAHAQEAHSLSQLQGTTRILMVFAPTPSSANFQRQMQLIERHSFELSSRNTVVVPVSLASDLFSGEQFPLFTTTDQVYARTRYHVEPTEFAVLLLNEDGVEALRSKSPMDIHQLTAKLDAQPAR